MINNRQMFQIKKLFIEQYLQHRVNNQTPILENLDNNKKNVFCFYYYYYPKMIYLFFQNKIFGSYQWIENSNLEYFKPQENILAELKKPNKKDAYNKYLNSFYKNPKTLGEDIFQNGMFFPFYNDKANKIIGYGQHRATSLYLLSQEEKIKQFLIISINSIDYQITAPIPFFILNKNNLYLLKSQKHKEIITNFFIISDYLPTFIQNYPDIIKPNSIFQTPKAFENFIKSPWEKYEQEYYKFEQSTFN